MFWAMVRQSVLVTMCGQAFEVNTSEIIQAPF
jgi:hypothetical protein